MAVRPRTRTARSTIHLQPLHLQQMKLQPIHITIDPTTNPPLCTFAGDINYVTQTGHIILFNTSNMTVHVTMIIETNGYAFDPIHPIVIVDDILDKVPGYYPPPPANFTAPSLSHKNTQLEFDDYVRNNKLFYYTLILIGPGGAAFSVDPIMVNN